MSDAGSDANITTTYQARSTNGAANLRSPGSSALYGRYIPAHVIQAQVIYTNKKVNQIYTNNSEQRFEK
jgi:hypothetical protein